MLSGTNGDLWSIRDSEQCEQQETTKVKAHAEVEVLNGYQDRQEFLLNLLADAAADAAAELSVNTLAVQECERWSSIAFLIAMRLAVLQAEADETIPDLVPVFVPESAIDATPRAEEERESAWRVQFNSAGIALSREASSLCARCAR